jgi:hypothetical protein
VASSGAKSAVKGELTQGTRIVVGGQSRLAPGSVTDPSEVGKTEKKDGAK